MKTWCKFSILPENLKKSDIFWMFIYRVFLVYCRHYSFELSVIPYYSKIWQSCPLIPLFYFYWHLNNLILTSTHLFLILFSPAASFFWFFSLIFTSCFFMPHPGFFPVSFSCFRLSSVPGSFCSYTVYFPWSSFLLFLFLLSCVSAARPAFFFSSILLILFIFYSCFFISRFLRLFLASVLLCFCFLSLLVQITPGGTKNWLTVY